MGAKGMLEGKTAIVTGAAKGLGREFALGLAGHGAKVLAVTRKDMANLAETVQLINNNNGQAEAFQADVSSEQDCLDMAAAAKRIFGSVDILVNNAAIYDGLERKPFDQIDLAEWDLVMNVNVKGAFLACRAVFPYMRDQGQGQGQVQGQVQGKIVNLASEVFFTGSHGFVHYVTSKGGIIGLTRALAVELGPHNICINCVAPGFTDTEASRNLADVGKYDTSKTPLRRMETPQDLSGAVAFFCGPASDFITGQTLLVDGGRAMH